MVCLHANDQLRSTRDVWHGVGHGAWVRAPWDGDLSREMAAHGFDLCRGEPRGTPSTIHNA